MSSQVGTGTEKPSEQTSDRIIDEVASLAVVEAVAETAETAPTALPHLNDVVDPDALNALFRRDRANGEVSFPYAGYRVTVTADCRVTVADPDE